MAKKENKTESEKHITLKVKFTAAEHKDVRMAAAEQELSLADFMHAAVLAAARQTVAKYYQREFAPKGGRKSDPSDE